MKMDDYLVRNGTDTDVSRLVSLEAVISSERLAWFKEVDTTEPNFRDLLAEIASNRRSTLLVAEREDRIVGWLECVDMSSHSEFVIKVQSEHRKKRVGSVLLGHLVEWARSQHGIERLGARVLEPNVGSRRLLERFGFFLLKTAPHAVTIRGVTMDEHLYYRQFTSV